MSFYANSTLCFQTYILLKDREKTTILLIYGTFNVTTLHQSLSLAATPSKGMKCTHTTAGTADLASSIAEQGICDFFFFFILFVRQSKT
jgi:hypothetical protein